jgi:hypothetical protein
MPELSDRRRRLLSPLLLSTLVCTLAVLATAGGASANTYLAATPVDASGPSSPFASCTADNAAAQMQAFGSRLYPSAELEPRVDVNPTNALNIVGEEQQDRWSDGGDRGLVASVSKDGGLHWSRVVVPGVSKCSGGSYDRVSDPWVSFAPNGDLFAISLSFDVFDPNNGVLVSKSPDGGDTWSDPIPLIADTFLGAFNDKESITADPYVPGNVYAVWDRFISPPSGTGPDQAVFRARSYRQQAWFSRTTNGGATWEPARAIYNPGTQAGTIGNIVVVLPNGDLVDGTIVFAEHKQKLLADVAVIRSTDKGSTWSKHAIIVAPLDLSFRGPYDPDNGKPIRSGGLPDFAVDPASGKLYAVWEDDHPTAGVDAIQFSESDDGGSTWSTPIKINKTPTNVPAPDQQAFTPTVKVAADGTVGVTYYDLRDNTDAPGLPTNHWLVHCHASCTNASSWSETHVAGPFDEEQAAVAGGYFVGDYEGMIPVGSSSFGPFFAQAINQATNPSDVFYTTVSPTP